MLYNTSPFESISSRFSNSEYTSTVILVPGAAPNSRTSCKSPDCLGLRVRASTRPLATLSNMNSVQFLSSPQSSCRTMLLRFFNQLPLACRKRKVPQGISSPIVVIELQGFIRIFFASDHLTDAAQTKLLETEGVSGDGSRLGCPISPQSFGLGYGFETSWECHSGSGCPSC